MLIQMAGDFMFWWLLVLGVGVGIVMVFDRFIRRSRKRQAHSDGPFAWLYGKVEKPAEFVEEAAAVMTASASGPAQPMPLFQVPPAEPRRYFIGKGPADEERA